MAHSGRPRSHDPIADKIRQAIRYASTAEVVAFFSNCDVNVLDGESRTPLIHAAIAGNVELLSWLIENGGKIDHQDRNGWSALHFAVQERHIDTVKYLLANGALIDLKDRYGNTPLWRAAFDARRDYVLVRLLVAHGAAPDSKNTSDRSPLDFAQQVGDQQLVVAMESG